MDEKEKALRLFKSQIEELSALPHSGVSAWKAFTIEVIKKYIGKDTTFLNLYAKNSLLTQKYAYKEDLALCRQNLQKCIQYIEAHGVLRQSLPMEPFNMSQSTPSSESNFISRMSEGWATVCVTVILPGIFATGFYIGTYMTQNKVDQQKVELFNENQELKRENERQKSEVEKQKQQAILHSETGQNLNRQKQLNTIVPQTEVLVPEVGTPKPGIHEKKLEETNHAPTQSAVQKPVFEPKVFYIPFYSTETVTIDRKNWVAILDQKDLNSLWFVVSGGEYGLKPGRDVSVTSEDGKKCSVVYDGIVDKNRFKFRLICD